MNHTKIQTATNSFNLAAMGKEEITMLKNECEKELDQRHKEEVRQFKAEMKKKAEKFGLVVKVETKK